MVETVEPSQGNGGEVESKKVCFLPLFRGKGECRMYHVVMRLLCCLHFLKDHDPLRSPTTRV